MLGEQHLDLFAPLVLRVDLAAELALDLLARGPLNEELDDVGVSGQFGRGRRRPAIPGDVGERAEPSEAALGWGARRAVRERAAGERGLHRLDLSLDLLDVLLPQL